MLPGKRGEAMGAWSEAVFRGEAALSAGSVAGWSWPWSWPWPDILDTPAVGSQPACVGRQTEDVSLVEFAAQSHAPTTVVSRRSFPHASHSREHRDHAFEKLVGAVCFVVAHEAQGLQGIDDGGAFQGRPACDGIEPACFAILHRAFAAAFGDVERNRKGGSA
jgi:hypothetical protein